MLKKNFLNAIGGPISFSVLGIVIAIIFVLIIVLNCFTIVSVGEIGIKVRLGQVVGQNLTEGIHFKLPLIDSIVRFNTKVQKEEVVTSSASKDLQDINMTVAVNYSINPQKVKDIYTNVGVGYREIILIPSVNETLKAVTSQYTAEEVITKRQEVSMKMREALAEKLISYGINIDNINILNLTFSDAFNAAIEAKQVAQQNALKAAQDLERVKIEAEQQVAKAKAEAESYKLKNQEVTDKMIELKWIEKWNGQLPTVAGEGYMLNLGNLGK